MHEPHWRHYKIEQSGKPASDPIGHTPA